MGKMEDTYIFKYLQLLLYCWAGLGLPMHPSLSTGRLPCSEVGWYQTATAVSTSRGKKKTKPNLKNLRSCDDFTPNIRVSQGGCNFIDTGRSRLSALKPQRCEKLGRHGMTCASRFVPAVSWLSARCRSQPWSSHCLGRSARAGCSAEQLAFKGP